MLPRKSQIDALSPATSAKHVRRAVPSAIGFGLRNAVFCPFIRDADFAARAPWRVAQRRLLDFLLVYVAEGRCRFTLEGRAHDLEKGDWCIVQPAELVELRGLSPTVTPYAHFDVWFNARREESYATRPGQIDLSGLGELLQPRFAALARVPSVFRAPDDEDWARDWLQIVELWSAGEQLKRLEADNRLGAHLLRLARHFNVGLPAQAESAPLGWVPSFLSTHLSEPISIAQMAARARLSPSRFQVVFRQTYGTSPGQYLLQMRVRHAGDLLRSSNWTLAHIADLCGFANVHHFAKTFKRVMGCAPGRFRKERLKDEG